MEFYLNFNNTPLQNKYQIGSIYLLKNTKKYRHFPYSRYLQIEYSKHYSNEITNI